MTTVLIKHYRETDNQAVQNKKLQDEFTQRDIVSVIVPSDCNVEWINDSGLAVIKTYSDTMKTLESAEQLQIDLKAAGVDSVILPTSVDVEVAPSSLFDFGINT